jgi:hypothetical protein
MGRVFYSLTSKVYCGDVPDHSRPSIGTQPRVAAFSDRGSKPDQILGTRLTSGGLIPGTHATHLPAMDKKIPGMIYWAFFYFISTF